MSRRARKSRGYMTVAKIATVVNVSEHVIML